MASEICPLCLAAVGRAASFTCPGCKSKYHKDCAAEAGDCIVVGCSAADTGKKRQLPSAQKQLSAKNASGSLLRTQKAITRPLLGIAVAASLILGAGIGYSSGDSAGYTRGYYAGNLSGYSDGHSVGYKEGSVAGCHWVFDQLSYQYLIGYNPNAYYFRYGSTYISRGQC